MTLVSDSWNDFGYRTLFHAHYVSHKEVVTDLGGVKIASDSQHQRTKIEGRFEELPVGYFSLGQSMDYYKRIRAIKKDLREELLQGLRDVVFLPQLLAQYQDLDVFTTSLLRYSETRVVLRDAVSLFSAEPPQEKTRCSFLFEIQLPGAALPHALSVELGNEPRLPDRIMALIGKNGTGKTWLLGRLAAALSGDEVSVGKFTPQHPAFQRVIAVSYSAFDRFNKPKSKRTFSYIYCGIYDAKGKLLERQRLFRKIRDAAAQIAKVDRVELWKEMIEAVLDKNTMEAMSVYLFSDEQEGVVLRPPRLSSGQLVLASTVTELVASIQEESIVLMDEPELHQHPNSVAGLLFSLNRMLETFKSFALIATHSPLVIQQIPAKYVRLFIRNGNATVIRDLGSECFGENLTSITQEVFQTNASPSLYTEWFKKATADLTDMQVLHLFPHGLSFNALLPAAR